MTKSIYYKGLSKNENVYVIMVKSIWQLLHVHITMQSYNLKVTRQVNNIFTIQRTTSTLYCNKIYNYGTTHSSYYLMKIMPNYKVRIKFQEI